jgi:hypothetical protein
VKLTTDPHRLIARFTLLDGTTVTGPVQGAGGFIKKLGELDAAACVAYQRRPHGLYEPRQGSVAVFPDYCAAGNGAPVVVDLATSFWEQA